VRHAYRIVVPSECEGERLDSFLGASSVFKSRSAAVKAIEAGDVTVDGAVVTSKKYLVSTD